ncbi:hypothetical protein [Sphingobacterium faecium]|uniref:hypothetical protein n=1 Tax=Sphingobacterium faecium TaxID=34087 RepID=UPI003207B16D
MKIMIKIILLLLCAQSAFTQTARIPESVRSTFEGIWQHKNKLQTNSLKIQFEPRKDYALFTDIGAGFAPSKTFHVHLKGNQLVLPAVRNQNDSIEMEIINGKLFLRTIPVEWDAQGKFIKADTSRQERRIFKRIKK